MIYHLLYPLAAKFTPLNVLRYITFRSVYALLTALVISILLGPRLIEWLKALRCRQHILEDVTCHQAKEGTPTMGGLLRHLHLRSGQRGHLPVPEHHARARRG